MSLPSDDVFDACPLAWRCRSHRKHLKGPHHFIVLMFEYVAVPDIAPGVAFERNDDAGDHRGVGADGVLPAHLVCVGRLDGAGVAQRALCLELKGVEASAIEDLEADQM